MADDRRAAIEAALNAAEQDEQEAGTAGAPAPAPAPASEEPASQEQLNEEGAAPAPAPAPAPATKPEEAVKPEEGEQPQKTYAIDKPPQSWKPAQKAKWATLDPDVRQEVIRRERDNERILGESAQARQIAGAFNQVIQPFMARIQSMGVHPLVAAQELFKADYVLSSGSPMKKAEMVAKLIQDYEVDVVALDQVLSGKVTANPQQSQLDALLQERLQPFMSFIQEQTRNNEAQRQAETQAMTQQVEAMANNEKFPYFDDVREDMADVIEFSAKRGVYLTLEQAYTRAVALNPEISQLVNQQADNQRRTAAAREASSRAQRARSASVSVSGSPTAALTGSVNVNDRRATIAAAIDQLEGR